MDPFTIGLIAKAAPAVLRTIAAMLPGRGGEVAGKLATVAEATQGLAPGARQQAVEKTIDAMTPDERRELAALSVKLREIDRGERGDVLAAESARHAQAQETIRAETTTGSEYARNSRPWIARQAYTAGAAYALLCELVARIALANGHQVAGADPVLLGVLLGPVGWYMTMRTIDSFSTEGRTK